jgi:hypothetical protein
MDACLDESVELMAGRVAVLGDVFEKKVGEVVEKVALADSVDEAEELERAKNELEYKKAKVAVLGKWLADTMRSQVALGFVQEKKAITKGITAMQEIRKRRKPKAYFTSKKHLAQSKAYIAKARQMMV